MTSPTKCYYMIQIILQLWSFYQSLVTPVFLWDKLSWHQFHKDLTRKTVFEGWSWFKFNNLGLALSTSFKFYTSVTKGLKLKIRKFFELIPTCAEVTGQTLVGSLFGLPILDRVNIFKFLYVIGYEAIFSPNAWSSLISV